MENGTVEADSAVNCLEYSPVQNHNDAINCISVSYKPSDITAHVATASEDGIVQVYNAGSH
eukprot:Gb_23653 [translate_table: standard]